jgi:hypothetical protein
MGEDFLRLTLKQDTEQYVGRAGCFAPRKVRQYPAWAEKRARPTTVVPFKVGG